MALSAGTNAEFAMSDLGQELTLVAMALDVS
jgi:hypothetical protein